MENTLKVVLNEQTVKELLAEWAKAHSEFFGKEIENLKPEHIVFDKDYEYSNDPNNRRRYLVLAARTKDDVLGFHLTKEQICAVIAGKHKVPTENVELNVITDGDFRDSPSKIEFKNVTVSKPIPANLFNGPNG
ncbi:MAG: hypothetical protein PHE27_05540 [Alphaproteobacteria bacterium]|nr:hypothetical protein [Alphaproteobacteria bacterium]